MIRVIYHWQVDEHNFAKFKHEWSIATNKIHQNIPGALGSFMLQGTEQSNEVLTIAKWESLEAWHAFWKLDSPPEMQAMHQLGKRISAKAYEELDDFTL